jgi:hypothetical protein
MLRSGNTQQTDTSLVLHSPVSGAQDNAQCRMISTTPMLHQPDKSYSKLQTFQGMYELAVHLCEYSREQNQIFIPA